MSIKQYKRMAMFVMGLMMIFPALGKEGIAQDETFDEETREVINQTLTNIYNDFFKLKGMSNSFSNFNSSVLEKDAQGLYTINYVTKRIGHSNSNKDFLFKIRIEGIDDDTKRIRGTEALHLGFPILGIRVSAYVTRSADMIRLRWKEIVEDNMDILFDHQQLYLPLQVVLRPVKDSFKVGESIEFEVILMNVSRTSWTVRDLDKSTLFFSIDGKTWGTQESPEISGGREGQGGEIGLDPGEELRRRFYGESFRSPREVKVFCYYNLGFKGVTPADEIVIKIVE